MSFYPGGYGGLVDPLLVVTAAAISALRVLSRPGFPAPEKGQMPGVVDAVAGAAHTALIRREAVKIHGVRRRYAKVVVGADYH